MSHDLSRRELFALLTRPLVRTRQRTAAREQRLRNIAALREHAAGAARECARCYAPFAPEGDELLCPACTERGAQESALLAELE
ncbi:MAG TPA: hypothetical protein VF932_09275 [Anaerolineae bacterium]